MGFPTLSMFTSGKKHKIVCCLFLLFLQGCGFRAFAQDSKGSAAPDLAKGMQVFERNNCSVCHPGGSNTMDPAHVIKGTEFLKKYSKDADLEQTIRKGFPDVGMPSSDKKRISDSEMKNLIAYVRSLSGPPMNKQAHK